MLSSNTLANANTPLYSGGAAGGGVSQLIAGSGIVLNPTSGQGVVTVSQQGGAGVTALNVGSSTLNGAVTVTAGSGITLTPSGSNAFEIAAGGVSPTEVGIIGAQNNGQISFPQNTTTQLLSVTLPTDKPTYNIAVNATCGFTTFTPLSGQSTINFGILVGAGGPGQGITYTRNSTALILNNQAISSYVTGVAGGTAIVFNANCSTSADALIQGCALSVIYS